MIKKNILLLKFSSLYPMGSIKELTWLKDAANVNKMKIQDIYSTVEFCNPNKIIPTTKQLLDKSYGLLKFVRNSLILSPSKVDSDRIDKISSMIEGINKAIYSQEGKKSAHEFASLTANLIMEALDITINAYERKILLEKVNGGI